MQFEDGCVEERKTINGRRHEYAHAATMKIAAIYPRVFIIIYTLYTPCINTHSNLSLASLVTNHKLYHIFVVASFVRSFFFPPKLIVPFFVFSLRSVSKNQQQVVAGFLLRNFCHLLVVDPLPGFFSFDFKSKRSTKSKTESNAMCMHEKNTEYINLCKANSIPLFLREYRIKNGIS